MQYNIYFNKRCLILNLVEKYANVNISNTFPGSKLTQQQ